MPKYHFKKFIMNIYTFCFHEIKLNRIIILINRNNYLFGLVNVYTLDLKSH